MKNFWQDIPRPVFVLAPMADVTDSAFRRIISKYSKVSGSTPYVTYTEFVSADGLCLAPEEGRRKLLRDLVFDESERPVVAQFFTAHAEHMQKAAALAAELGFDGVDINMGCPVDAVVAQGAGAKLIQKPALARELIAAAKRGAPNLPISVKSRLGYSADELEEWLPALLKAQPAAITLHARTRKEMSKVPARWERIKRAVEIRNQCQDDILTLIIGNGDVKDLDDAREKARQTGCDGVMLGRAMFGRPWLFDLGGRTYSAAKRLRVAVEHAKLFEELLGGTKSFALMKKHFKAYVEGFDGAKELRTKLMETQNAAEVEEIVEEFIVQTGRVY